MQTPEKPQGVLVCGAGTSYVARDYRGHLGRSLFAHVITVKFAD
jgi:hypothetical protein